MPLPFSGSRTHIVLVAKTVILAKFSTRLVSSSLALFAICVVINSLDDRDGFLGTFYDEPDVEPDPEPLTDIATIVGIRGRPPEEA
jgi:hypothetical protein